MVFVYRKVTDRLWVTKINMENCVLLEVQCPARVKEKLLPRLGYLVEFGDHCVQSHDARIGKA